MRNFAQIFTAIWKDPIFRALDASAQRTYLMLVTQPDISAAGTLGLTLTRWADLAADTTRAGLERDLAVLEQARFVYVDDDTEELLVRSFVKHDKGYGNIKRRGTILDAARLVISMKVRRVLWAELEKVSLGHLLEPLPVSAGEDLSDRPYRPASIGNADKRESVRRVVTEVSNTPPALNRKPSTATASGGGTRAGVREEPPPNAGPPGAAEEVLAEWIGGLKKPPQKRIVNAIGIIVQAALGEGQDDADVREALKRWQAKGNLGPAVLPSIIHEVANGPKPGSALARASPAGRSKTDDRVNGWLALGEEPPT